MKITPEQFPINKRHQRVATAAMDCLKAKNASGFQSISVTSEWRPRFCPAVQQVNGCGFPINKRHQRVATFLRNIGNNL